MRGEPRLLLIRLLLQTFLAAYVQAQCSGTTLLLTATDTIQNLTGPIANSATTAYLVQPYACSWLISPAAGFETIVIYFQQFSTESSSSCGAADDYVIVVDGVNKVSGFQKACVSGTITHVITQGVRTLSTDINHQMYIEFVADGDANVGNGFWIKYIARVKVTEAPATLSTGAIVGIAVGSVAVLLVIIVVVAVVVLKKQQQRIEELEWEYDSDDSYYDSDSDYFDSDPEAEAGKSSGPRPLPPLTTGLAARTAAVVPGHENYKAPNALPSLNQEDLEKARKKARRRRRRKNRKRKDASAAKNKVAPTNGNVPTAPPLEGTHPPVPQTTHLPIALGTVPPAPVAGAALINNGQTAPQLHTERSVATSRGVVIQSSTQERGQPLEMQEAQPQEKTLSDLENEIAAHDAKSGSLTVRPAAQDPVFNNSNFAPARG